MDTTCDFIARWLVKSDDAASCMLAKDLVLAIRAAVQEAADASSRPVRDFASTFLFVLSGPDNTIACQIGDGAVVLYLEGADSADGELLCMPMGGEYANMTHFVCEPDTMERLFVRGYASPLTGAAVMSDGLQRLALDLGRKVPHAPFFSPLFQVLATASPDSEDALASGLERFLNSNGVNGRTDDDKALGLAHWRH